MPRPSRNERFANVNASTSEMEERSTTPSPAESSPADLAHQKMLDQFDVAYGDTVQLNVNVSPALRKAIKLKALEESVPVTVALRQVLQRWVEGK